MLFYAKSVTLGYVTDMRCSLIIKLLPSIKASRLRETFFFLSSSMSFFLSFLDLMLHVDIFFIMIYIAMASISMVQDLLYIRKGCCDFFFFF